MIFQLILAANVFFVGYGWTVSNCPMGLARHSYLKVFEDKCYVFELFMKRSHQDALEFCGEDGGILVSVKNKKVNDFVSKTTENYLVNNVIKHVRFWIDLKYDYVYDKFIWTDGSEMEYENFKDGHQISTPCITIDSESGRWVRSTCDQEERFVCEYPVDEIEFDKKEFPTSISKSDCPAYEEDERIIQTLGTKCYLFYIFKKATFSEADAFCKAYGANSGSKANLVIVDSEQINVFLQHHLFVTHRFRHDSYLVWIGLTYDKGAEQFRWTDGSPVNFTNFREPEGRTDNCFAMSSMTGEWKDSKCGDKGDEDEEMDKKYFICEFETKNRDEATHPNTTNVPAASTMAAAPTSSESSS